MEPRKKVLMRFSGLVFGFSSLSSTLVSLRISQAREKITQVLCSFKSSQRAKTGGASEPTNNPSCSYIRKIKRRYTPKTRMPLPFLVRDSPRRCAQRALRQRQFGLAGPASVSHRIIVLLVFSPPSCYSSNSFSPSSGHFVATACP